MNDLNPGTYYQDVLADGTRSVLRQNFPQLKRVSFDKRPPVAQTLCIDVTDITNSPDLVGGIISHERYEELTGLHLDLASYDSVAISKEAADALFKAGAS